MLTADDLARYVDAFNRGDDAAYGAFYAPDVQFRNGGGTALVGETLARGDRLELESMALYEVANDRFVRVEATTIAHKVLRQGAAA